MVTRRRTSPSQTFSSELACADQHSVAAPAVWRIVAAVLVQMGAEVIRTTAARPGDVPILWQGKIIAYGRPPPIEKQFEQAIERVEQTIGSRLHEVPTSQRDDVVRLLQDQGVFEVRAAVDRVAVKFRRSRTWVYAGLAACARGPRPSA